MWPIVGDLEGWWTLIIPYSLPKSPPVTHAQVNSKDKVWGQCLPWLFSWAHCSGPLLYGIDPEGHCVRGPPKEGGCYSMLSWGDVGAHLEVLGSW